MTAKSRPLLVHPDLGEVSLVDALHALADPTRLAIVGTLVANGAGQPCGTFPVNVAPSTLSHHFRVLREAGLIRQEERGNRRWTWLRSEDVETRLPGLLRAVAEQNEDQVTS